jgi:hypothetical protein
MVKLKKMGTNNEEKIAKITCSKKNLEKILVWAFYCVNDGKEVEAASHQVMRCILCYDNAINIFNPRTKERKGLIIYYKNYGITTLKKHVDTYHFIIVKNLKKKLIMN